MHFVHKYKWPILLVFLFITGLALFELKEALKQKDLDYFQGITVERAGKIKQVLTRQIDTRMRSLHHMAQRWEAAGGTSQDAWQKDADNYLHDQVGLKAVEWVDASYHIRWAEPMDGNQSVIGMDIRFDKERADALKNAEARNTVTLTPPFNLVQGYKAFLVYAPVYVNTKFNGFIVAVYNTDDFFRDLIAPEISYRFAATLANGGQDFFRDVQDNSPDVPSLRASDTVQAGNQSWTLTVAPTKKFLDSRTSSMPETLFISGLIIAALIGLGVLDIARGRIQASALREQAALLDLAHDAIFVRNQKDEIIFWSHGAERTYGWTKKEMLGRVTHDVLKTEFPKSLPEIQEDLERDQEWNGELVHTKKDGQKITVASRWAIQRDQVGKQIGMLEINRDVSEREELMKRLLESNTELERFAYVASHDMQEPLRMISGISDIVVQDYAAQLDDEGKNYLNIMRDSSERMRAMIRDLLDYARVDKGGPTPTQVHGSQELGRALENLSELIREKQARVTAEAIPEFSGNPIQFMRLLQNLIANAITYQPEGQTPFVHIRSKDEDNHILLSIEDNGIGIAEDYVGKVFEPFRRLHSWDDIKGTGLGLAVCKKIVENHGGKIWIVSKVGEGTKVCFTIMKSMT